MEREASADGSISSQTNPIASKVAFLRDDEESGRETFPRRWLVSSVQDPRGTSMLAIAAMT